MDTIEEFTSKFHEQYIDAETLTLKPESEFRNFGSWDSLTGMAVLVMIKENYGVDIPVEIFRELKKVKDVYDYVSSQIEKRK